MISVVMTTYNGERYILEQLESIRIQTRQPDEVIIQDDASNDDTKVLIDYFIRAHGLKNWKVYKNVKNIGWRNNFYDAISKAHGDIIFFADQDDVWCSQKIKTRIPSLLLRSTSFAIVKKTDGLLTRNNGKEYYYFSIYTT